MGTIRQEQVSAGAGFRGGSVALSFFEGASVTHDAREHRPVGQCALGSKLLRLPPARPRSRCPSMLCCLSSPYLARREIGVKVKQDA